MPERVVFVELSGGLILGSEAPDALSLDSLRLTGGCLAALARFGAAGYKTVVLKGGQPAGNVSGDPTDAGLESFVTALLESQGVTLAALEACRHTAGDGCDCALPGIGLVADYLEGERLDRARSIVVGAADHAKALARAIGVRGFGIDADMSWSAVAHTVLDEPRRARVERTTRETDIVVEVDLDRVQDPSIQTGIGFFDHMLEQLGKHGGFALSIRCTGDLEVDEHHTVEDVALALGQALKQALGDKRGIGRYGFLLPMDEAEAQVAIDLSGRAYAVFEGEFPREAVGGLPTELVSHFFRSLAETLGAALHVSVRGENAHHMVEGCFKGVARALRQALAREGTELPSTKGQL
jgi:imidazoleglycerol-phosphate dehydratase/histidinol-phosphatase